MAEIQLRRITTYVGADGTPLKFRVRDASTGEVMVITGYTITIRALLGSTVMMNAAALTITDGANGLCQITPTSAQVATAGIYNAQLKLVYSGVTQLSREFEIEVLRQI